MQSKMIFIVLFMLSFSAFHDTFISMIDKNEQSSIVHYMHDEAPSSECAEYNELHSMFHFMAIIDDSQNEQIEFAQRETIPHRVVRYLPPLEKISNKPPIV